MISSFNLCFYIFLKYEIQERLVWCLVFIKSLKTTVENILSSLPFIHFKTTYLIKKYPLQSFTEKVW